MDKHRGEMLQQQLPIALVRGERVVDKPKDLYIPPQALEINLSEFQGPLDLLLYLIRKQKFDIVDLPIAPITLQYFQYLAAVEEQGIELAAEYLLMAATLAEIKSKLLLPKQIVEDEDVDPRAELVRKLQEYELIKQACELLKALPQVDRDVFLPDVEFSSNAEIVPIDKDVGLEQLIQAYQRVLSRQAAFEHHHIEKESISTQEKMKDILDNLQTSPDVTVSFCRLINVAQGRQGVIVTFLAVLELIKSGMLQCDAGAVDSQFKLRLVS